MDAVRHPVNLTDRELIVKFAILVGLGGIFIDAVIAHGLFWDNDPYWTYWITKTFLITTVFALGVSLIGVGLWQGIAITAAHTLILTAYYDWLAPVGLPQEPEWLDMQHLWVTGVPAHFLSILAGFLGALWMWRRNRMPENLHTSDARGNLSMALLGTVAVLLLDGLITQGLLMRQFAGWTFFVTHLLITFVFLLGWGAFVGFDPLGVVTGAATMAFLWVWYEMYLGPLGLPDDVRYLGFEDLWTKAFPGAVLSGLIGIFAAARLLKARPNPIAIAAALLVFTATFASAQGLPASATAEGRCMQVVGPDPVDMSSSVEGSGTITIQTFERGNRWSHVQNTDAMSLVATWTADGMTWKVMVDKPMPRHPLGKYTVWNGVVYGHEMHGHTGIGTPKLPLVKPEIALWGWATVERDGVVISRMASAHAMVATQGEMEGVMLEVDTEDKALVGAPDGYLTVMWHEVGSLKMPEIQEAARKATGWRVLIGVTMALFWLAIRKAPVR